MASFIRPLETFSSDLQEIRRRKLLNILLLSLIYCALVGVVFALVSWLGLNLPNQLLLFGLCLYVLATSSIVYIINRYGSSRFASVLFLIFMGMGIILSDEASEIATGQTLLAFVPFVVIGSFILSPSVSFILAAIVSVVVTAITLALNLIPNPFVIITFFMIAFVSWLSARSFQEGLEDLQILNHELDRIAKMLVRRDLELTYSKEEIITEKGKIDSVVNSLVDGLIMVDEKERVMLINPKAKVVLKVKEEENVIGRTLSELTNLGYLKNLYEILGNKVEWTGKQYELQIGERLKRTFQVRTTPVVTKSQQIIGLLIILYDITREKEIERMKTEFVSIAAHQLRTPLSSIKWALRLVLDGDLGKISPKQVEVLESGYQSNERMIRLINDLLDVARIEEGHFLYKFSLVSLEDIVKKVIKSLADLISAKKIMFNFRKPEKPLPLVRADIEKIELAVQNLLENAIRYSKDGGKVIVDLNQEKENVKMEISDNGIGIPEQQKPQVFTKFYRGYNAIKAGTEGSGLGLFITKNIIEEHGGKIWFESEEQKGTTFWVAIPINPDLKYQN